MTPSKLDSNIYTQDFLIRLQEYGARMNRATSLPAAFDAVAHFIRDSIPCDNASVVVHKISSLYDYHTLIGLQERYSSRMIVESNTVGAVLRNGQAMIIANGTSSPILQNYASQIIVPLIVHENLIGTLNVASRKPDAYKDTHRLVLDLCATPLAGVVHTIRQAEESQRSHKQLRHHMEQLEVSNQELDAYNHTIAHNLKTPLTSLLLKTEMLKKQLHIHDTRSDVDNGYALHGLIEQADNMQSIILQMTDMVDQLLMLASVRDTESTLTSLHLSQPIKQAIKRFKDLIEREGIELRIPENEMPLVLGHRQWFEEIFAILIDNAIKYRDPSKDHHVIEIECISEGEVLRVEIRDNGIGIESDDIDDLFKAFKRLNAVKSEGTGLGLSIVRRIVSRLGGEVGVKSTPKAGSTFWFTVPNINLYAGQGY